MHRGSIECIRVIKSRLGFQVFQHRPQPARTFIENPNHAKRPAQQRRVNPIEPRIIRQNPQRQPTLIAVEAINLPCFHGKVALGLDALLTFLAFGFSGPRFLIRVASLEMLQEQQLRCRGPTGGRR